MVQLKQRFQSFEEYLAYDDGTENLYELFSSQPTPLNSLIPIVLARKVILL